MRPGIATRWGTPIVGFFNTKSSAVQELKHSVARDHLLPQDILADATMVVTYFLPFTSDLAETNLPGTAASPEWARVYAETNALFSEFNEQPVALNPSHG